MKRALQRKNGGTDGKKMTQTPMRTRDENNFGGMRKASVVSSLQKLTTERRLDNDAVKKIV